MPSFDAQKLLVIAQQLDAAQATEDWSRLSQLDALLSRWVLEAQHAPLLPQWQQVIHAHQKALHACQQAREAAERELRHLQNSQEAQKAYAWQEILE